MPHLIPLWSRHYGLLRPLVLPPFILGSWKCPNHPHFDRQLPLRHRNLGRVVLDIEDWQYETLSLRKHSTKQLSLYSPTGLGDVVDINPVLRGKIAIRLLAQLLISGAIIVILSAVAVVSASRQWTGRSAIEL